MPVGVGASKDRQVIAVESGRFGELFTAFIIWLHFLVFPGSLLLSVVELLEMKFLRLLLWLLLGRRL